MADPVYDVNTKQPQTLADDELDQSLAAGKVSYQAGKTVPIVNDKGETATVPAENIQQAIGMGWKVDTPSRQAVRGYIEDNKGIKGDLKVGLGQFVDEGLMGLPELIYDKTGDPLEVAKKDALKKEHDLANSVGGGAGFVANMVYGGPLYKSAAKAGEKSAEMVAQKLGVTAAENLGSRTIGTVAKYIAKRMVAKSAGGAVEGALISAPHAITEAALGDPDLAGESLLAGGLIGSAFGGAGSLVSDAAKGLLNVGKKVTESNNIIKRINEADNLGEFFQKASNEKAVESLGATSGEIKRFLQRKDLQTLGQFLKDEQIVTFPSSKEQIFNRLAEKTSQYGKDLSDTLVRADEIIGSPSIKPAEIYADLKTKIEKDYLPFHAKKGLAEKFEKQIGGLLENPEEAWTLSQANKQKSAYYDTVKNWGLEDREGKDFARYIGSVINDKIESKVAELSPETLKTFKDLKTKYGYLEEAETIAKNAHAKAVANNDFGLTSYVAGAGGLAAGDLGTAATAFVGREGIRRYGDQIAAAAYNKMAGLLHAEKAMKGIAMKLDAIPQILKAMKNPRRPGPRTMGIAATQRLVSPDSRPSRDAKKASFDRVNNLEKLRDTTSNWVGNPAAASEQVAKYTMPISAGGAPNIGAAFNGKMTNALQFLYKAMPKPPRPRSPFAPQYKFRPSDRDMHAFEQKLRVLQDPFVVFEELKNGTLTHDHMDALKTVYPQLHQQMVNKVQQSVINGVDPIPYAQRVKLSLLMDVPMDSSMTPESVKGFQQNFAEQDQSIDKSNAKDVKIAEDTYSDVQKLM